MTTVKLEDARRVIGAAEKKAREIGQPMKVAVADKGGNIVAHARMVDAWIGSIDIYMKKAHTSSAFEIETKELVKHCQAGGEFFGVHASNNGKIMILAGGIPLKLDGKVVGIGRGFSKPGDAENRLGDFIGQRGARSYE